MSVAADPASGSEMPMAMVISPLTVLGRTSFFCCSVPKNSMTRHGPTLVSNTWNAAGRHSLASSSWTMSASSRVPPWPPYSSGSDDAEEAELGQPLDLVVRQRGAVAVPLGGLRRIHLAGDLGRELAQRHLLRCQFETAQGVPRSGERDGALSMITIVIDYGTSQVQPTAQIREIR